MSRILQFLKQYIVECSLFFFYLAFYYFTMFPGAGGRIFFGDSIKWQYLWKVNGISHPTGYPQYLFLSELFSRVFVFLPEPERITLISVFFGAVSLVLFYVLIKMLTGNITGSLLTTCLLSVSYVFWTQATEAEVYTLNAAFLLGVILLFLKFYETGRDSFYIWGCAVYAFSFGNHLSMITLLPAIVFICLYTDRTVIFNPVNLLLVMLCIIGGALQYMYIYVRAHTPTQYSEIAANPTFRQLIEFVTGGQYKGAMFYFSFNDIMSERFSMLLHFFNINFTPIGIGLISAGFWYAFFVLRKNIILAFLVLILSGQVFFFIGYSVDDIIVFFLPVYIISAAMAGFIFLHHSARWLIPVFTFLIIYICWSNVNRTDILKENSFGVRNFSIQEDIYKNLMDTLPMYYPAANYHESVYFNYQNIYHAYGDNKVIITGPDKLNAYDSFYFTCDTNHIKSLNEGFDFNLVREEDVTDFIKNNLSDNNVLFISLRNSKKQNLPQKLKKYLSSSGSGLTDFTDKTSFLAVLSDKSYQEKISDNENVELRNKEVEDPSLKETDVRIRSAGPATGDFAVVRIGRTDYSLNVNGLNIVVYNKLRKCVTKVTVFDLAADEKKCLYKAVRRK